MNKSKQLLIYIVLVGTSLLWILGFSLVANRFSFPNSKAWKIPIDFLSANFVSFSLVWMMWKAQAFVLTPLKYWFKCLAGVTISTILVIFYMYFKSLTNNTGWGISSLILYFIIFYPLISVPSSLMIFLISYPIQLFTDKLVSSDESLA